MGGMGPSLSVGAQMTGEANLRLESSAAVWAGNGSSCRGLEGPVFLLLSPPLCCRLCIVFVPAGTVVDSSPPCDSVRGCLLPRGWLYTEGF